MKALLIVVLVLLALVAAGWLSFAITSNSASVTIDSEEARQDIGAAAEKGEQAVEQIREEVHDIRSDP